MYAFILIKQATFTTKSTQKLNKIHGQGMIFHLTLRTPGAEMGLMVVAHCRERWPKLVDGREWPLVAGKMAEKCPTHSSAETEHGLFWGVLEPLQWLWWLMMVVGVLGVVLEVKLWW